MLPSKASRPRRMELIFQRPIEFTELTLRISRCLRIKVNDVAVLWIEFQIRILKLIQTLGEQSCAHQQDE